MKTRLNMDAFGFSDVGVKAGEGVGYVGTGGLLKELKRSY